MCGRFQLDILEERLVEIFGTSEITDFQRRWNIAPTQRAIVIRASDDEREAALLRWGLVPSWADDESIGNRMINARSESARTKPAYRAAFASRRCVVPATGFYEWKTTSSKAKQPYLIRPSENDILALAGLWERWTGGAEPLETFTILTTAASESIKALHERMPVALPAAAWRRWLETEDADEAEALLASPIKRFDASPVSTRINSPANDDPNACAPAEDVDPETGEARGLFG